MPPVKKPAKPGKPNEPKKPSSRSKTKNAECSQAASTWQLSLRGKATATAETYQTLAKCRALASSQRKADAYGRTGKLSEQGRTALESRLQSRFESGLITDKSRKAKLADLLAKRKAAQGDARSAERQRIADGSKRVGDTAPPRIEDAPKPRSSLAEGRTNRALDKTMGFNGIVMTRRKAIEMRVEAGAKIVMSPSGTRRLMNKDDSFYDESQISKTAMDYAAELIGKRQTTPKYSLGGQLAPGRGTAERNKAARNERYERLHAYSDRDKRDIAYTRGVEAARKAALLDKVRTSRIETRMRQEFEAKDARRRELYVKRERLLQKKRRQVAEKVLQDNKIPLEPPKTLPAKRKWMEKVDTAINSSAEYKNLAERDRRFDDRYEKAKRANDFKRMPDRLESGWLGKRTDKILAEMKSKANSVLSRIAR